MRHTFHFFLPEGVAGGPGDVVAVCAQDARRMSRVLRLGPGEAVEVAEDSGRVWAAVVAGTGTVRLTDVMREPQPAAPLIVRLAQAGPRSDTAIEKLVELGVERISPLEAQGGKREARIDRWQRIAEAAACQAKRPRVPRIEPSMSFAEALAPGAVVLSHVDPDDGLVPALARVGRPVALLVGPEAGFQPDELEAARRAAVPIATLGDVVLRTETAAIAAAVLALSQLGCLAA
jgi:16S rRNA (uracil1498-N3)-methyltransferase